MKAIDTNPSESATPSLPSGNRRNDLSVASLSEKAPSKTESGESAVGQTDRWSLEETWRPPKRAPTTHEGSPAQGQDLAIVSTAGPVHSVFTKNQKCFIVLMASFGGFFSPVSANIYFPALNALAQDLNVTSTLINLTLTSYMV